MFLPPTRHVPPDWILRLIASLMAGPETLTAPASLEVVLLAPAIGIHAVFSLALGYVFCRMEDSLPFWRALVASVLLALAVYVFDFYVMTRTLPWFASARGGATLSAHVLFAVTIVLAHKGLRDLRLPRPTGVSHAYGSG